MGENGPRATFKESAPRLAARIEQHLATGADFKSPKDLGQNAPSFQKPNGMPPGGW